MNRLGPVQAAERLDPGLAALSLIAGYYRIAADPAQLRHQLALTRHSAGTEDLLRAANLLGLKSRVIRSVDAKRNPLNVSQTGPMSFSKNGR
jgi:ABC-type bacteriocin/lantibiotic exporter with double-glycine peptidase domain